MSRTLKRIATGLALPALATWPTTAAADDDANATTRPWTMGPVIGLTAADVFAPL